jgi:hypothetical protein
LSLCARFVFRVAHVDPPAVEENCVDRLVSAIKQVDGVAPLSLAAVRGLNEVTCLEDRGRQHVETGHDEVGRAGRQASRRRDDFAVLVCPAGAVARRLRLGGLLDEERAIDPFPVAVAR